MPYSSSYSFSIALMPATRRQSPPLSWTSQTPSGRSQFHQRSKSTFVPPASWMADANGSYSREPIKAVPRLQRYWGRLAALVMRLTQSLFEPTEVRLVCYVDDPLAAIRGSDADRRMFAAVMVLVWAASGFKLAYAKGQLDRKITWIGGTLWIESNGIRAFVKQSIIDDIQYMLRHFTSINVVSKKELRSLIGKLNHAAGLLIVMRPFMDPQWAARAAP